MAVTTLGLINNDAGPQSLKTRAGDTFHLQIFAYPKTGNTGGGTLALVLNCTDSRGINAATQVVATSIPTPATGAWTVLDGYATIPAGYDTVSPAFTMTSVPVTDQINVDDVLVREVTVAQSALDAMYQAVAGGSSVNNSAATVKGQIQSWLTTLFGQSTLPTSLASGSLQNIADAMHQVTFGGSAVNTAMDLASLKAMFAAQPASTVVPPPNPSTTGAINTGTTGSITTTTSTGNVLSTTGTHTPGSTDNYVVGVLFFAGTVQPSGGITYGSQSGGQNVQLGALSPVYQIVSGIPLYAQVYGGFITAGVSGAQTLTAIASAGTGFSYMLAGYTQSYSGVVSVGAVTTASGNNNPSQAVSSASNDYIFEAFFSAYSSSDALSSFTGGATRYTSGQIAATSSGTSYASCISGDAPGTNSVTFGATQSNAFGTWLGISVNLIGATTTPIGSVFRAHCNSGSFASTSGTALLPNNMFGTVDRTTADYSYAAASANRLTVLNAGTYIVRVGLLINSTSFYNQYVYPVLYHNGAIYEVGQKSYIYGSNANWIAADTFIVYCNAGDTLQPGQNTSLAYASTFSGSTDSSLCYFSCTLANRSLL